jgi:hypothetical protein
MKWADSIKAILKIAIIQNRMAELRVYYDKEINTKQNKDEGVKKIKVKKSRDFIFKDQYDRNHFTMILRRNYFNLNSTYLILEHIKVG